ncbi:MAG TPA: flagellar basal body rod protein FlgC [Polyangia bacterium]
MDFFTALHISSTGLSAERTRVNIASSNLANAETTRTADGGPYKRLDPVFRAVAAEAGAAGGPQAVTVAEIATDETPGKKIYSPGHPDADADGFVVLPTVNPVHEVVNLLSASRGYEANTTAVETLKQMAGRALEILK